MWRIMRHITQEEVFTMRGLIALTVIVSVVGGFMAAFAVSQLSGSAGAAPATRAREDQITIFSQTAAGPSMASSTYSSAEESSPGPLGPAPIRLALDAGHYPSSSTFRLEGEWVTPFTGTNTYCIRLFDRTLNASVTAS